MLCDVGYYFVAQSHSIDVSRWSALAISFYSRVIVDITHQHFTHNQHAARTFTAVFSTSVVVSVCVRFRLPDTQCCTDRTFIFGSRKRIASHGSGAQDSDGRRKP